MAASALPQPVTTPHTGTITSEHAPMTGTIVHATMTTTPDSAEGTHCFGVDIHSTIGMS